MIKLQSTLTCPSCGQKTIGLMPTDACQYIFDCTCGARLKPKPGDCCVYRMGLCLARLCKKKWPAAKTLTAPAKTDRGKGPESSTP